MRVLGGEGGEAVCERCEVADRPLSRLRGMLGRPRLEAGTGLILEPCNSVHTWFMRFPIDAVFLDDQHRVLKVRSRMGPWRLAAARRAHSVLELPAGEAGRRGVAPGGRLCLTPVLTTVAATDPETLEVIR